ncbi:MBL fold metallo-hydrolase [Gluconacetobacter asukensis]|uniref:MBL fold metallo-hydrolase n=1 Tax=Gluconacetobacter asukensis TaxID=1017181 RepID=A0A7W4NYE1_9PROT|nr:hypothetical protein [Gluconacetobacter asukensis]MBB2170876.1 hypothetical protein [Gluconacetobacter asukensis]
MAPANRIFLAITCATVPVFLCAAAPPPDGAPVASAHGAPGCAGLAPHACIGIALEAMGGANRLAGVRTARYAIIGHREEAEQSYRQAPFQIEYGRETRIVDYRHGAVDRVHESIFPSTAPDENINKTHVVVSAAGAVMKTPGGDRPAARQTREQGDDILHDEPMMVLQAAAKAPDLRYAAPEWLHAAPHTVVTFTDHGQTVRLALNAGSHLPDAIERTRTFEDFWNVWGDVDQRIYLDSWQDVGGVLFPASRVDQRNGLETAHEQYLDVRFDPALASDAFSVDSAAAAKSLRSPGWERPFPPQAQTIVPGVWLFQGAWNVSVIEQDDGLILLEAPISASYTAQALDAAAHLVPGKPIKAVISTTDSWPHVAGLREAVARGIPVYQLDLNRPLLDRLIAAPHILRPDDLARHPRPPQWHMVNQVLAIPSRHNPIMLIPICGPSTERQYMVYWPDAKLLYASDTLVLNPDNSLYNPELMHEVETAVARAHIVPQTVYAMHQAPMPWGRAIGMVP